MSTSALRFGVLGAAGYRAESWKCWTNTGSGKGDVYVACRALGSTLKLSLHESGRWHVAFDFKRFPELFDAHSAPPDRFMSKWEKPAPLTGDLTLACRIHVPWHAATIPDQAPNSRVHWVQCAPNGQSIEFVVFIKDRAANTTDWPGRDAMQSSLVGTMPLGTGGVAYVVYHTCDALPQELPAISAPRYFKGQSDEHLLAKANRAIMWGESGDGSIIFQESPVAVTKSKGSCPSLQPTCNGVPPLHAAELKRSRSADDERRLPSSEDAGSGR